MVTGDAEEARSQTGEGVKVRLVEHELLARDGLPVHRVEHQHECLIAWEAAHAVQPEHAVVRRLRRYQWQRKIRRARAEE
jgi:hypothetical protein